MGTKTFDQLTVITTTNSTDKVVMWKDSSDAAVTITFADFSSNLSLSSYLKADGTVTLTGNLNAGGFNITNLNLTDGVDLSAFKTAYDAKVIVYDGHIANTSNPHLVTAAQANAVAKDGSIALTADWDAGARKITLATVSGRSGADVSFTDSSGNIGMKLVNGGIARFLGPVSETAITSDRIDIGVASGTPRIIFEDSGSTVWQVDNSAGTFRFFTAGVLHQTLTLSLARFYDNVQMDGSLGVGVSPSTPLHVYHATTSTLRMDTVFATGAVRIDLTGTDMWRSANTNDLKLGTFGGSSFVTIKGTTGYTAIGTITAPDNLLHVHNGSAGSVSAPSDALIIAESSGDTSISILSPFANYGRLVFGNPTANNTAAITYDHTAGNMKFATVGAQRLYLETLQFYPTTNNAIRIGTSANKWTEVWAVNGTIQTSDERLKTDVDESDLGLDFVMALKPIKWVWPNDHRPAQYKKEKTTRTKKETVEHVERKVVERNGKHVLADVTTLVEQPVTELQPVFHANGKPAYEDKPILDEAGNQVGTEKVRVMHAVPIIEEIEEDVLVHEEINEPHSRPHYGFSSQQVKQAMDAVNAKDFGGYIYDKDTDTYHLKYAEFTAPMVKSIQELARKIQALEERLN